MDQIEFADGFDRPDTLAFGLGAGQLAVVMVGALAAYMLVRSPLPPAGVDPVAGAIAVTAAGLGWLRVAGRPALDWAVFAALFWMRPRRGMTRWEFAPEARADGTSDGGESDQSRVLELFGKRRTAPSTPPANRRKVNPDAAPPGRDPTDGRKSGPGAAALSPSPADPSRPILRPTTRSGGAHRVTFFSLRGGTGRSTLATELTCLIASSRSEEHPAPRVALVDLDLRSPSVAIRLGTPERTLLDFALAPPEDRSVIDFMVTHASGARVLLGPQSAVNPEWPVTPALLREVLRELDMEGFDLVVLDLFPELNPLTTTAICACDDVFIVVVPTAGGVHDAYRSTEALRRLGLRQQLRYIVNRSRPGTDLSEPMADLGGQLIGDIPDDDAVVTAENAHRLVGIEETGPAAIALRRLARRVGSELRSSWPA
jgi:MinD-like ATPase involved in chromosome partitioning or flagellar assembly